MFAVHGTWAFAVILHSSFDGGLKRRIITEIRNIPSKYGVCFLEGPLLFRLEAVHVFFRLQDKGLVVFVDHLAELRVVWQLELIRLFGRQTATQ